MQSAKRTKKSKKEQMRRQPTTTPIYQEPLALTALDYSLFSTIEVTSTEFSEIIRRYAQHGCRETTKCIEDVIDRAKHFFQSVDNGTPKTYQVSYENLDELISGLMLHRFKGTLSYPYVYITYGRSDEEINQIISETNNWHTYHAFKTYLEHHKGRLTPRQEFRQIYPFNLATFYAEFILLRKISDYDAINIVRREVDYLNRHKQHTMEKLQGEQRHLVLNDIDKVKKIIRKFIIVEQFREQLPQDLRTELLFGDEIIKFLTSVKTMENGTMSNSVGQVMNNEDLVRYLAGYI